MYTIDITTKVSSDLIKKINQKEVSEVKTFQGHLGTHFDVMDKEFPLDYTELEAVVFDVRGFSINHEISMQDIEIDQIQKGMFVAFCTDFIEQEGYGTHNYFTNHPQLSLELIHWLLNKKIAIIGVDFAGVRRGSEHTKTDQLCADQNVFVVENLCNLSTVLSGKKYSLFKAGTYPINFEGQTGLPCRVVARI